MNLHLNVNFLPSSHHPVDSHAHPPHPPHRQSPCHDHEHHHHKSSRNLRPQRRVFAKRQICRSFDLLLIYVTTIFITTSTIHCFDLSQFHRRFSQLGFSSVAYEDKTSVGGDGGGRLDGTLTGADGQTENAETSPYHLFHDKHRIEPYFDNTTARNVTTSSGKTVYLPCRVLHLGDRTVSWIRRKDLHVLTVGKFTYTSDERFKAVHLENTDDWSLQIRYPQNKDAGSYECQISTMPKRSLFVSLDVVISKAKIIGGPSLYINSGSPLNLTCVVNETPGPPDYIFWHHNGEVINYDSLRGIRVQTEKAAQTTSKLIINKAHPNDSGNYSCVPSNAEPAHIAVHVLNNGGHPAAMQHGKRSAGQDFLTNSSACSPFPWQGLGKALKGLPHLLFATSACLPLLFSLLLQLYWR